MVVSDIVQKGKSQLRENKISKKFDFFLLN